MSNLGEFGGKELVFDEAYSFDKPVPPGDYVAAIDASEIKNTKNGDKYLSLVWRICEGSHRDRLVYESLNLWYGLNRVSEDSEKDRRTRGMASNALVTITKSVGMTKTPKDSSELHGKPCIITVKIREASGGYQATAEVKGHRSLASGAPAAVVASTPAYVPIVPAIPAMTPENGMPWA